MQYFEKPISAEQAYFFAENTLKSRNYEPEKFIFSFLFYFSASNMLIYCDCFDDWLGN